MLNSTKSRMETGKTEKVVREAVLCIIQRRCFLKLAEGVIRDFNAQLDTNGMNYEGNVLTQCGFSLGMNVTWSESQLTQELQVIISKRRTYFEGFPDNAKHIETESDCEWVLRRKLLIYIFRALFWCTHILCKPISNNVSSQMIWVTLFSKISLQNHGSKRMWITLNPVTCLVGSLSVRK